MRGAGQQGIVSNCLLCRLGLLPLVDRQVWLCAPPEGCSRGSHQPPALPGPPGCSILPLESISQTIERNTRELLARNFEVAGLVRQVSVSAAALAASSAADLAALAGSEAAAVAAASRTGSGVAAEIAAVDEFGEMTGASAVGAEGAAAVGKSGSGAALGSLIQLTASSGEAAAAAQPRRVQFGGATVIEVGSGRGSMDGAHDGHGGGSPQASPRTLNRMVRPGWGCHAALPSATRGMQYL